MAFQPVITYAKNDFIETDTGNKVSRRSTICGPQNIILGGKSIIQKDVVLRGDLRRTGAGHAVVISLGRYCLISEGCIVRPPGKCYKGNFNYYPLKIGDHVHIGPQSIIQTASIGSFVEIGAGCIIGPFTIIKDVVQILPNTIVPPATVIPSMSIFGGNPGRIIGELSEGFQENFETRCKAYYGNFKPAESTSKPTEES